VVLLSKHSTHVRLSIPVVLLPGVAVVAALLWTMEVALVVVVVVKDMMAVG
jgi:hypothetical protein